MLSAILYLGNVTYKKKATGRDEGLEVGPPEVLDILSQLLKVEYYFPALVFGTTVCCALLQHFAWIHCGSACLSLFYDASMMMPPLMGGGKNESGEIIGIRDGM